MHRITADAPPEHLTPTTLTAAGITEADLQEWIVADPGIIDDRSKENIAAEFVNDICNGIDNLSVRGGIVGETGLSERTHAQEKNMLRAGARAALQTGAQLTVHPPGRTPNAQKARTYPSSRWGGDFLYIKGDMGFLPEQIVICHMDRTLSEEFK
jgi:predicted metal-dependent phosphotriesterase family hydrolase